VRATDTGGLRTLDSDAEVVAVLMIAEKSVLSSVHCCCNILAYMKQGDKPHAKCQWDECEREATKYRYRSVSGKKVKDPVSPIRD
jgi:hypothetical protein